MNHLEGLINMYIPKSFPYCTDTALVAMGGDAQE